MELVEEQDGQECEGEDVDGRRPTDDQLRQVARLEARALEPRLVLDQLDLIPKCVEPQSPEELSRPDSPMKITP